MSSAARRRNLPQAGPGPEDDRVVGGPKASAKAFVKVAHGQRRAAGNINLTELPGIRKHQPPAVRRPERDNALKAGAERNVERPSLPRVERADPETSRGSDEGEESHFAAIGRNVGQGGQAGDSRGRADLKAYDLGFGRLLAEVDERQRRERQREGCRRCQGDPSEPRV